MGIRQARHGNGSNESISTQIILLDRIPDAGAVFKLRSREDCEFQFQIHTFGSPPSKANYCHKNRQNRTDEKSLFPHHLQEPLNEPEQTTHET